MSRQSEDTRVSSRKKKIYCLYKRKDGLFEGMYLAGWGEDGKLNQAYFTAPDEKEAVSLLMKYENASLQRRKELPGGKQEVIRRGENMILTEDEMRRLIYMAKYNVHPEIMDSRKHDDEKPRHNFPKAAKILNLLLFYT